MARKKQKFTDQAPFMLVLGVFCAISLYLLTSFFTTINGQVYQVSVLADEKPITAEANAAPQGYIFKDVPYVHKNGTAILYFRDTKIVKGYDDGTFKPENGVNRAEFLKILVSAMGEKPSGSNCFTDVKDEWFAPYICYAKSEGWVGGYADGSYQPAKMVNKAEAVKITTVAFGYEIPSSVFDQHFIDTPKDAWYTPYIFVALSNDLIEEKDELEYHPSDEMKRAGTVEVIYRSLNSQGLVKPTI